jgi:hypothetical protein
MGLPGAGKTALLNLLAGETVVPENVSLPRLQLRRGQSPVMTLVFADGSTSQKPGRDLLAAATLGPVSVILDLPLQSLSLITPMELAPGASDTNQARAINWASKHADVFIWCSEKFTEGEQLLWQGVPTVVKDQGVLLITKTDLVGDFNKIPALINGIAQVAGDEFSSILPVSARLANQSFSADGSLDRDMFRTSGAPRLIAEIRSQIEKIRQTDADTATMMLVRYAVAATHQAAPTTITAAVPEVVVTRQLKNVEPAQESKSAPISRPPEPPVPAVPATASQSTASPRAPSPFSAQMAKKRLAPGLQTPTVPAHAIPQAAVSNAISADVVRPATGVLEKGVTAQEKPLLQQAIVSLVDQADAIQASLPKTGKTEWPQIVSQTAIAVDAVAELLQSSKSPGPRAIAKDVSEIQDLLMLIQLEQGSTPAYDAINLLIQLKRDLECALAA